MKVSWRRFAFFKKAGGGASEDGGGCALSSSLGVAPTSRFTAAAYAEAGPCRVIMMETGICLSLTPHASA